jgi:2-oxoglutarate ferredoxin oxidoreductase subunit alpha
MSLQQEGLGLAHMMEVPLVLVNVQRVGPSTGMPTLPAQGDIIQARHGSHGDYNPIVFYPGSVKECFRYVIEAFNASEESLSPVILLLDGFLAHIFETVDLDMSAPEIKSRKREPLGKGQRHFTGLLSKEGIPQTKNTAYYREWYQRTKEKMLNTASHYRFYDYMENKDADTLLIAYGITSRVIFPLKESYSIFRPVLMFPELREVSKKYRRIVVIEMNDGQYKGEVERVLKREVGGISVLGGTIHLKEIKERLG